MKTHIVEQDKNGFITPIEYVYLVRQTQPEEDYNNYTIAVYTDEQDAIALSRKLNKEYGYGVRFDENYDYVESEDDYDYDNIHYYDVDKKTINPDMNLYL